MGKCILSAKKITKCFPGVKALDNVDFELQEGEIHALCGMNGCGKSTLLKIITGNEKQDKGKIFVNGEETNFHTVIDSKKAGINMVYQELSLVPYLSVAENILLGNMPKKNGLISYKEALRKSKELLERLGLYINPSQLVEELSVAEKQMVEIAKALSQDTKILLLDEPSAVLTATELKGLFKIIQQIKEQGVTVVYISHRLEEVFEIADRITILRDGKNIDVCNVKDITVNELISMIIGRSMEDFYPEIQNFKSKMRAMEVVNLNNYRLKDISFHINEREIVGIYGVVGSGQKELAEALFGVDIKELNIDSYKINGKNAHIKNPIDAIKNGLAFIPEERKQDGVAVDLSIKQNIVLPFIKRVCNKLGLINTKIEDENVEKLMKKLSIKAHNSDVLVNNLSGGNQQKVVVAKWLGRNSNILICFEPTRGIDVDAKAQVYNVLEDLKRAGASIILISSELSEVIGMTERLYIMRKGEFKGELTREEYQEERILGMVAGLEV